MTPRLEMTESTYFDIHFSYSAVLIFTIVLIVATTKCWFCYRSFLRRGQFHSGGTDGTTAAFVKERERFGMDKDGWVSGGAYVPPRERKRRQEVFADNQRKQRHPEFRKSNGQQKNSPDRKTLLRRWMSFMMCRFSKLRKVSEWLLFMLKQWGRIIMSVSLQLGRETTSFFRRQTEMLANVMHGRSENIGKSMASTRISKNNADRSSQPRSLNTSIATTPPDAQNFQPPRFSGESDETGAASFSTPWKILTHAAAHLWGSSKSSGLPAASGTTPLHARRLVFASRTPTPERTRPEDNREQLESEHRQVQQQQRIPQSRLEQEDVWMGTSSNPSGMMQIQQSVQFGNGEDLTASRGADAASQSDSGTTSGEASAKTFISPPLTPAHRAPPSRSQAGQKRSATPYYAHRYPSKENDKHHKADNVGGHGADLQNSSLNKKLKNKNIAKRRVSFSEEIESRRYYKRDDNSSIMTAMEDMIDDQLIGDEVQKMKIGSATVIQDAENERWEEWLGSRTDAGHTPRLESRKASKNVELVGAISDTNEGTMVKYSLSQNGDDENGSLKGKGLVVRQQSMRVPMSILFSSSNVRWENNDHEGRTLNPLALLPRVRTLPHKPGRIALPSRTLLLSTQNSRIASMQRLREQQRQRRLWEDRLVRQSLSKGAPSSMNHAPSLFATTNENDGLLTTGGYDRTKASFLLSAPVQGEPNENQKANTDFPVHSQSQASLSTSSVESGAKIFEFQKTSAPSTQTFTFGGEGDRNCKPKNPDPHQSTGVKLGFDVAYDVTTREKEVSTAKMPAFAFSSNYVNGHGGLPANTPLSTEASSGGHLGFNFLGAPPGQSAQVPANVTAPSFEFGMVKGETSSGAREMGGGASSRRRAARSRKR